MSRDPISNNHHNKDFSKRVTDGMIIAQHARWPGVQASEGCAVSSRDHCCYSQGRCKQRQACRSTVIISTASDGAGPGSSLPGALGLSISLAETWELHKDPGKVHSRVGKAECYEKEEPELRKHRPSCTALHSAQECLVTLARQLRFVWPASFMVSLPRFLWDMPRSYIFFS